MNITLLHYQTKERTNHYLVPKMEFSASHAEEIQSTNFEH